MRNNWRHYNFSNRYTKQLKDSIIALTVASVAGVSGCPFEFEVGTIWPHFGVLIRHQLRQTAVSEFDTHPKAQMKPRGSFLKLILGSQTELSINFKSRAEAKG